MVLGGLVLGSLILYLKAMRIMMFQLSGYCFRTLCRARVLSPRLALRPAHLTPDGSGQTRARGTQDQQTSSQEQAALPRTTHRALEPRSCHKQLDSSDTTPCLQTTLHLNYPLHFPYALKQTPSKVVECCSPGESKPNSTSGGGLAGLVGRC